ncbi:HPP family protein [Herbaspirillum sp. RTI4]|uniref:HPP family protein n=1 Tax=Herbaspirillum sp. RTI4 TaxID=3048640 RepID=UPI002AB37C3E|nr:HPP family protein [Herbaspirillum sp. RTI4]MDY7578427.1 HPP family protein [Herbaspirillum sp. RTI4]MEA9982559.1 HPP family protein [Herbaspirillum sp. RTI4]
MQNYFKKMRGGSALPARPALRHVALSWLGGFLAITAVAGLTDIAHLPLVLGSFGATCVLVFGFPESPFSQPRNVIGGHFLASLVGLLFLTLFGAHWWSMALAVGTSIALMQLTRTVHPPAGSNPVIVMLAAPAWGFLLMPTLIGAVVIVLVAVIFNNLPQERSYPKYWL